MGHGNVSVGLWDVGMEVGRGYGSWERVCGAVGPEHGGGTWLWATGTWVWDVGMEVGRGYGPEEHVCGPVGPGGGGGTWLWVRGTWLWGCGN